MRFHRALKTLSAIAVALGVGLVVVASASADSGKIKFRGEASVLGLGPGATTSTYEYKNDGSIRTVSIHTVGETVVAGLLDAECKPSTSAACDALNGSILFDVHSSDENLRSVEVVPNPFFPGLDALSGKLSGELEGALTVTDPAELDVALGGTIQMKIQGTATLGCFLPIALVLPPPLPPLPFTPVPVSFCTGSDNLPGSPFLVPVVFDVDDHGEFLLGPGFAGVPVTGGEGHVKVRLAGDLFSGASGTVVINDATLFTP